MDDPVMKELRRAALEELERAPGRPPLAGDSGVSPVLEPSTNVDGLAGGVSVGTRQPPWMNDPVMQELRRAALEEIERAPDRPPHSGEIDPVLAEVLGGAGVRELAAARDDLERAKRRYVGAIRGARVAGLSWSEIGRVMGESKQALHRRFGDAS
jgi:hypothetical protein